LMTNRVNPASKIPLAYICYNASHTGFSLLTRPLEMILERVENLPATAI
jgi:hypothetical protein